MRRQDSGPTWHHPVRVWGCEGERVGTCLGTSMHTHVIKIAKS